MKIFVLRRWGDLTERQKLIRGIGGFLGVGILSVVLWAAFHNSPPHFSGQPSLAVTAPLEDGIQFTAEVVKPSLQGEDYFVNYRLQREQSRQEAKAMLEPLLNSTVSKTQAEAQQKWLELSNKIEKESQIENVLKIKGFKDAIVDVNQNAVNVIIFAPALSQDEVKLIQSVVTQITNIRLNQVTISYKS